MTMSNDTINDGFDPWATSTGLWQEADAEIRDAHFGYDAGYNNGDSLLLLLEIQSDDPDVGEGGTDTLLIPVGNGWEKADKDGEKVQHESGKRRNVNASTGLGTLIKSVKDCPEVLAVTKGDPTEAATWKGLPKVTFTRVSETKTFSGEERTYNRIHITGLAEGATTTAAPTTTKAAPATAKSDAGDSGLPKVLTVKLTKLAKECDDHDTFVERALTEIDGADEEPASSKVLDAAFYEGLKG